MPSLKIKRESRGEEEILGFSFSVPAGMDSVPVNVLLFILELESSVSHLKSCRLVSKSWNEVCCRILRKTAAVPITKEEGGSLETFKEVLLDRYTSFPQDWPNPFQNFKIQEAAISGSAFLRFFQRDNVKITTLNLVHGPKYSPTAFVSILERHKGWILHLGIRGNSTSAPFAALSEKLGTGWRSLKSITLKDTCGASNRPCLHMEFITALAGKVRLQQINLQGLFPNIASIFAPNKSCWDKLTELTLKSDAAPLSPTSEEIHDYMKWTHEIQFAGLTKLMLWFSDDGVPYQTSEKFTPYVLPLLQGSSQTLKDLRVTFLPLSSVPRSPKLTNLVCTLLDGERIQDITEDKFPSLITANCTIQWTELPVYTLPSDSAKNRIVTKFNVYWDGNASKEATEALWPSLRDHFPNLRIIWVQPNISCATLSTIRRRLPQLQDIEIRSMSSSELLGIKPDFVAASTAKGWPCQDFENCPLFDFAELTRLCLGEYVEPSPDVIAACLGKLTKIQYLTFHWNESLDAAELPKHLGHIPNVTILYTDKQHKGVLEKLAKTMPCLTVSKFNVT